VCVHCMELCAVFSATVQSYCAKNLVVYFQFISKLTFNYLWFIVRLCSCIF